MIEEAADYGVYISVKNAAKLTNLLSPIQDSNFGIQHYAVKKWNINKMEVT